jgi:methionine aminopeptidase
LIIAALLKGCEMCVAGADVHTVCQAMDAFIEEEIRKVYNSKKTKKLDRGIAFPTCLSINNVMGHFSPLKEDSHDIKEGDVVKM